MKRNLTLVSLGSFVVIACVLTALRGKSISSDSQADNRPIEYTATTDIGEYNRAKTLSQKFRSGIGRRSQSACSVSEQAAAAFLPNGVRRTASQNHSTRFPFPQGIR